jgi:4-nitrophenyl phosphatase
MEVTPSTAEKSAIATNLALSGKYNSIIFDCDGVLWSGKIPIPHARNFLHLLIKEGIKPLFLTNTSLYGPQDIQVKLKNLMELDVSMEDIYTANVLAGQYVKQKLVPQNKKKAYVIGREVLIQEVRKSGIEVIPASIHNDKYGVYKFESPDEMDFRDIDVVVMGYDDHINLYKMAFATYAVQSGVTCSSHRLCYFLLMLTKTLRV